MNIRRQASLYDKSGNKKKSDSITQLFDIKTLDLYCRYVISTNQNIRISSLNLVKSLFDRVNIRSYGNDEERIKRIEFIKSGLEARINKHLKDPELIIQYINGGLLGESLLDTSYLKEISDEELAYINDQSCVLAETSFIDEDFDEINKLSASLKSSVGTGRAESVTKIKELVAKLNSGFNRIDGSMNTEPSFSTDDENFDQVFRDIYSRETSSSRTLTTGLTGLNRMINGGVQSGRVYLFFGTAATGKSFLALDLVLQIAKYNANYKTQDPTKKPCIVFLTMENSVQENIARIYNMLVGKSMNEAENYAEAKSLFKEALDAYTGGNISIYMEYQPYMSKSTNYLYEMVDKVKASGSEPILFVMDHIKRIRSAEPSKDIRVDLGNIVNEFKAFANIMDIPVISISHLNRDAAKNIGENKNKKDIIRTLGSNNVSDSLLMVDNCDVGIILNKETDSDNNLYMGFMQIKTRTRCDLNVFFQPFKKDSALKLIEDVDNPVPAYKRTLLDSRVTKLKNYGSDYVNEQRREQERHIDSIMNSEDYDDDDRDDEDDDMFNDENMNSSENYSVEDVLMPFNQNQNKFTTVGKPSQPIYPVQQQVINERTWDDELIFMKYNQPDTRTAIAYIGNNGMIINDGVEDLMKQ